MLRPPVVSDLLLQFATALRTSTPWHGVSAFWYPWKGKGGGREEFHNLVLIPGETFLVCRSPLVEALLLMPAFAKRITSPDCACKATGNQLTKNEQQECPLLVKRLLKVDCTVRSITITLWSSLNVPQSLECFYCKMITPDCLVNGNRWHSSCYSAITGNLPVSDTDILFIEVNYSRETTILPSACRMTLTEVAQQRIMYIQRVKSSCHDHDPSFIGMLAKDAEFRTFIISLQLYDYGFSLIHEAIRENWIEVVLLLLETNLDYALFTTTNRGSTALHQACFHGRIDILCFLLQYGANPFQLTKGGYLPFHNACLSFGKNVDVYMTIIGHILRRMLTMDRLSTSKALKPPSKWCNTSFSIPLYEQECKRIDTSL